MINKKSSDTTMRVSASLCVYRIAKRRGRRIQNLDRFCTYQDFGYAYPTYGYGIRSEDR